MSAMSSIPGSEHGRSIVANVSLRVAWHRMWTSFHDGPCICHERKPFPAGVSSQTLEPGESKELFDKIKRTLNLVACGPSRVGISVRSCLSRGLKTRDARVTVSGIWRRIIGEPSLHRSTHTSRLGLTGSEPLQTVHSLNCPKSSVVMHGILTFSSAPLPLSISLSVSRNRPQVHVPRST